MRIPRRCKADKPSDGYGRVYVIRFELLDGNVVHKVGMTNSDRVDDRLIEVVGSYFKVYRHTPVVRLRLAKKSLVPMLLEKHIHSLLAEYKYCFEKKFDGSCEFFSGLDEEVLLDYLKEIDDLDFLKTTSLESKYYDILTEESRRRRLASEGEGSDTLPF